MTQSLPPLGFIGLGAMGSRMATRLLRAGYDVTVHDAQPDLGVALGGEGAHVVDSPREVADRAKVVLVSLPSPDAARSVVSGLRGGTAMRYYIDLSTTGPRVARELAAALGDAGMAYVDAPVSGAPAGAEAGTLTIMVSGPPGAIERVMPILNELGSTIFTVGNEPGQGQMVKVINNLLSACSIAITAEAVALGVRAGLDPKTLLDVVAVSSGSNTAVVDKFPKQVLTRRFDHGFRLTLMAKDVRLCLDEARGLNVPMLLGGGVDELWGLAARQAKASDDCTAIVQMFERWAGTTIGGATSTTIGGAIAPERSA